MPEGTPKSYRFFAFSYKSSRRTFCAFPVAQLRMGHVLECLASPHILAQNAGYCGQ